MQNVLCTVRLMNDAVTTNVRFRHVYTKRKSREYCNIRFCMRPFLGKQPRYTIDNALRVQLFFYLSLINIELIVGHVYLLFVKRPLSLCKYVYVHTSVHDIHNVQYCTIYNIYSTAVQSVP